MLVVVAVAQKLGVLIVLAMIAIVGIAHYYPTFLELDDRSLKVQCVETQRDMTNSEAVLAVELLRLAGGLCKWAKQAQFCHWAAVSVPVGLQESVWRT